MTPPKTHSCEEYFYGKVLDPSTGFETNICANCNKVSYDHHLGYTCNRTDVSERLVSGFSTCDQWEGR